MGNVIDVLTMDSVTYEPVCIKLTADTYLNTLTGEVGQYQHITNRAESYSSLRKTMSKIRTLINCNVTNPRNSHWVTLTYATNMTDTKRLYKDFDRFWKRFRYFCAKQGYPDPKYISVVEPQGRGAWHIHLLVLWSRPAPFIPNNKLAEIWGNGFVSIKCVPYCDNLGAYLTAYLTNMPEEEVRSLPSELKTEAYVSASLTGGVEPKKDVRGKKIIKGARLALYPPGFNIYRHSRGIKMPVVIWTTNEDAQSLVSGTVETYHRDFEIVNENGVVLNRIRKASYNSASKTKEGEKTC